MKQQRIEQLLDAARKGGAASAKKSKERALDRYYTNPVRCKYCGEVIEVGEGERPCVVKKKKFCNHSCAAKYNNIGRNRHNGRPRQLIACLYCGEKTTNLKFCSTLCTSAFRLEKRWKEFDVQEKLTATPRTVKKYLINRRGHRCEICELTEWEQRPIALVLDHIDGNSGNNDRDNLRLICPNCDAQLPTYKGKNKGKGRYSRRQRYREGKSY